MKYSGIGGQAVMEGVMMRNGSKYAVAVRTPQKEIVVDVKESMPVDDIWHKIPIIRGVVTFVDSLYIGMSTLTYSASFFEDEEDAKTANDKKLDAKTVDDKKHDAKTADDKKLDDKVQDAKTSDMKKPDSKASNSISDTKKSNSKSSDFREKAEIGGTVALSIVMALGIFFVLPYLASKLLGRFIDSQILMAVIEGVIRLVIFIGYVWVISFMEEIKRTYMYHGAEHKCINCIENGRELTVENVRESSRFHKRCGTSFVFIVLIISIFVFMFIDLNNPILQLLLRLLLVPVIAGISYEFIRLAGRSENGLVDALSKPGIWLQKLTTAEPDDDMIEVAIASVEAVFDWKAFI